MSESDSVRLNIRVVPLDASPGLGEVRIDPANFEPEITLTIEWWKSVLHGPKQDNGAGKEIDFYIKKGDFQTAQQMAGMDRLNKMASGKPSVNATPERLQKFEDVARRILKRDLKNLGDGGDVVVRVDYYPTGILYEICQGAGLDTHDWPCKTTMWVRPGSVTVRYGYGVDIITVYRDEQILEAEKARIIEAKRLYEENFARRNAPALPLVDALAGEFTPLDDGALWDIYYEARVEVLTAMKDVENPEPLPKQFHEAAGRTIAAKRLLKARGAFF